MPAGDAQDFFSGIFLGAEPPMHNFRIAFQPAGDSHLSLVYPVWVIVVLSAQSLCRCFAA
ncbi:hypothetical protein [Tunturibacter empetritectus]|uniref:Uncharacterized protein n=1 Tax=Tunturiibacter lichenicola TaxID=2051959 RepID=A0A7W8J769_9BACT|nr:hypothetical protein [Edaphobacter lichenicola]MBB5342584.1 hypothetical protein [Edaphobacter lichenicola]